MSDSNESTRPDNGTQLTFTVENNGDALFFLENPKHVAAQKAGKVPMDLIPYGALAGAARVLAGGAVKYGRRNWTMDKIKATTYVGAIARHALLEWAEGIDVDKDSGEHPLDHVIACCLLVKDAMARGCLIDDRDWAESKDPNTGSIKRRT